VKIHPGKEEIMDQFKRRQDQQKLSYDKSARDLPNLYVGQKVGLQDPKTLRWSPAKVVEKGPEPRSYTVLTPSGSKFRRNRKFLKDLDLPVARNGELNKQPQTSKSDIATKAVPPVEVPPKDPGATHQESPRSTRPKRAIKPPDRLISSM
jgi:hypothetical protein